MQKIKVRKVIGETEIEVECDIANNKEAFAFAEFWSSVPTKHPSGATDLQLVARTAKASRGVLVKYYEITCKSQDERFTFGQLTDGSSGGLFPKGWEPMYHGAGMETVSDDEHAPEPPQPPRPERTAAPASNVTSINRPASKPVVAAPVEVPHDDVMEWARSAVTEFERFFVIQTGAKQQIKVTKLADGLTACTARQCTGVQFCPHQEAVRYYVDFKDAAYVAEVEAQIAESRKAG